MELRLAHKKAQIMSIIILLVFLLMLATLFTFAMLEVSNTNIQQSLTLASGTSSYASLLKQSANEFARASLGRALQTLAYYEYTPSLRKSNFISNLSLYLSQLMINGTVPNETQAAMPYTVNMMGNLTLQAYNSIVANTLGFSVQSLTINETRPTIFQTSPYYLNVAYVENIGFNVSSSTYKYSISVNASIPLNGTPDLLYAQRGIMRDIRFSTLSNITSIIGGVYATTGNYVGIAYGTIYALPSNAVSGASCPTLPAGVSSSSIILATYNAIGLEGCMNNYAGLIAYIPPTSTPTVPYLIYSSSTNILQQLPTGRKVLIYGPELATLDIENLRNAISNGYYFSSPYTPSYIDRASYSLQKSSPNGIFTFSGYHTQVAKFNGNGYVEQTNGFSFMNNANQNATISIWVNPSSPNGDIVDELGQTAINTGWHDTWIDLVNRNVMIRVGSLGCVNLGQIPLNAWSNIVMTITYNGVALNYSGYINGVYRGSGTGSRSIPGGSSLMYYPLGPSDGTNCGDGGAAFSGEMANYQFYSASLPKQSIYHIYQEGIEGIPVSNSLVLWYPLNGNANDYSGNGNNGVQQNIIYPAPFNYTRDSIKQIPMQSVMPLPGVLSCTNNANCGSPSAKLYISNTSLELNQVYAAMFRPNPSSFNTGYGISSSYITNQSAVIQPAGTANEIFTITAWVDPVAYGTCSGYCVYPIVAFGTNFNNQAFAFGIQSGGSGLGIHGCGNPDVGTSGMPTISYNKWTFIAVSFNGISYNFNENGTFWYNTSNRGFVSEPPLFIASQGGCNGGTYEGEISNVQIYNTALTGYQVDQLYRESITGVPLYTQNLVMWYPLTMNSKDYASNFNGQPINVTFVPINASSPIPQSMNYGVESESEVLNLG